MLKRFYFHYSNIYNIKNEMFYHVCASCRLDEFLLIFKNEKDFQISYLDKLYNDRNFQAV